MKIKALKSLSAILGIIIAASALLSWLSITAFADAELPSDVKFSVTIDNSRAEEPIENISYVYLYFPYVYETETGKRSYSYKSESCNVTKDEKNSNMYTFDGTLHEKINTLASDGKLPCYVYFYSDSRYLRSDTIEYTNAETEMKFTVINKTMTPDWVEGRIFNLGKPSSSYYAYVRSTGGAEPERYSGSIEIYTAGGKVATPGGGTKDTKTAQLALFEEFSGSGYCNTTASKEIKWIVTKEEVCPTSFKQKSDTSVCKVSKGKVSAVAEGNAFVWACRVDPNDKEKVSVDESCCVEVYVRNAPTKIEITKSSADDAEKLSSIDLNIGESKRVYLKFTSKSDSVYTGCDIKVTKGQEYIGVSDSWNSLTVTALPTELKDNKPVKAEVTVTSDYNTKKAKLKVTVSNGVVGFDKENHPVQPLQIITSDQNQTITVSKDTLDGYVLTSAEKYFPDDETISAMETTDKPKVFVTSAATVTDSMVYKTGKKTTIKFSGTKSPSVSASYKNGAVTLKVKKGAAEEKGNVIIVYNTEKYLAIPYTISKTAPTESGTETPQS